VLAAAHDVNNAAASGTSSQNQLICVPSSQPAVGAAG
jgi:hypothetical protein